MKDRLVQILIFLLISLIPKIVFSAPTDDRLIGKIVIRNNNLKIDSKSRKEILLLSTKIKKIQQPGAIKIYGHVSNASNAEEFMTRSAFMAREVEQQLKASGIGGHQLFIVASKYDERNTERSNFVTVYHYPHILEEREIDSLQKANANSPDDSGIVPLLQKEIEPQLQRKTTIIQINEPKQVEPLKKAPDMRTVKSQDLHEDPNLANELVRRAKEKAAERSRRGE